MSEKLKAEFKKETGAHEICPGIDIYRVKYISWLETQLEQSRAGEAELVEGLNDIMTDLSVTGGASGLWLRINELLKKYGVQNGKAI